MPRPPDGERTMTAQERQLRFRQRNKERENARDAALRWIAENARSLTEARNIAAKVLRDAKFTMP